MYVLGTAGHVDHGKSDGIWLKLARQVFHGCAAGRGSSTSKPMAMSGPVPL
ncbi:MAG: hypothetical protein SVM79_02030 [Chloroflexota bacterium]|nr:hypothetical protein [Chloroflexota bacterium]